MKAGILRWLDDKTRFDSFDDYWNLTDRPILGQIFEERGRGWSPGAMLELPTWFSNLLPEGPLRRTIASAVGVNEQREFFLLARIGGDDLPGAIRVAAGEEGNGGWDQEPHDDEGGDVETHPVAWKFSLAGVQLKFSVIGQDRSLTVPTAGHWGTSIAKMPDKRSGFDGVPEAEFAGLMLARAVGIDVPDVQLVDVNQIHGLPGWALEGGGKALVVRRFDRKPGGRVHAEELAQVLNLRPRRKYGHANFETVAKTTAALVDPSAVGTVIDRIMLNVLLGNGDAHVKNWAYTYNDGKNAQLSPAYDIVPTVLYVKDDDLGLKLNGSRSFGDVTYGSFERLASKAGWDRSLGRQRAADAVDRIMDSWTVLKDLLPKRHFLFLTRRRDSLTALRR